MRLMNSSSWKDSALIFTYDEAGGFYDHVSPQPHAEVPTAYQPMDLQPGDICDAPGQIGTGTCDFTYTGYRVPLIVISPFAKKNYVSHTVYDYTAILKLIETRFNVPALTKRDAAQADMSEFFDFVNVPWATPPSPPAQTTERPVFPGPSDSLMRTDSPTRRGEVVVPKARMIPERSPQWDNDSVRIQRSVRSGTVAYLRSPPPPVWRQPGITTLPPKTSPGTTLRAATIC